MQVTHQVFIVFRKTINRRIDFSAQIQARLCYAREMLHHKEVGENVRISGSRWVPFLHCQKPEPKKSFGPQKPVPVRILAKQVFLNWFSFHSPFQHKRSKWFFPQQNFFLFQYRITYTCSRFSRLFFAFAFKRDFSCLCCKQYFGEDRDVMGRMKRLLYSQGTSSGPLILCNR